MRLSEVWDSTPREVAMVMEAARFRRRDRAVTSFIVTRGTSDAVRDLFASFEDRSSGRQSPEQQLALLEVWSAQVNARQAVA